MPTIKIIMLNYLILCIMENYIDFIKETSWDFIVPLTIVVIGIVYFVVAFNRENKRVNKHRKDIQQQIVNEEFAKKIANKYKGNKVNNQ